MNGGDRGKKTGNGCVNYESFSLIVPSAMRENGEDASGVEN